jgi:hypothetical protein
MIRQQAMTMMDGLIAWANAVIDRLMMGASEEVEDALAETAITMVVPSIAMRPWAMMNDNDP